MASFSLKVGSPNSFFTSYGIKEFCDFPAGNFPSFIEVIMTVSKSSTRVSRTPISCKPSRGSPSKETSAKSITCL